MNIFSIFVEIIKHMNINLLNHIEKISLNILPFINTNEWEHKTDAIETEEYHIEVTYSYRISIYNYMTETLFHPAEWDEILELDVTDIKIFNEDGDEIILNSEDECKYLKIIQNNNQ